MYRSQYMASSVVVLLLCLVSSAIAEVSDAEDLIEVTSPEMIPSARLNAAYQRAKSGDANAVLS